jgi:hypothetical protein
MENYTVTLFMSQEPVAQVNVRAVCLAWAKSVAYEMFGEIGLLIIVEET